MIVRKLQVIAQFTTICKIRQAPIFMIIRIILENFDNCGKIIQTELLNVIVGNISTDNCKTLFATKNTIRVR